MGRPPISRSGFGCRSVRGRSRVPSPAARMKAVLNRRLFSDTSLLALTQSRIVTAETLRTQRRDFYLAERYRQIKSLPVSRNINLPLRSLRLCGETDSCLSLFLSEFRINLHQRRHDEPWDCCGHDPEKVVLIAYLLLEPATEHGRHHHTQGHDPR
jgi:hypothetical protein